MVEDIEVISDDWILLLCFSLVKLPNVVPGDLRIQIPMVTIAIMEISMTKTSPNQALFIRLRADTRALLDRAAEDQRRSRASLVDEALRELLKARYADVNRRLDQFLSRP